MSERRRIRRAQSINGFGACMTGVVLITVLITKFTLGAWIAIVAMGGFFVLMRLIQLHYDRVAAALVADETDDVLPSRNHAVVLVSTLHKPTLRALAYARATRPDIPRRSRSTSTTPRPRSSSSSGTSGTCRSR